MYWLSGKMSKSKTIFFLLCGIFSMNIMASGQNDTVIYIGVNGTLTGQEKGEMKMEVIHKSEKRAEIRTYRKSGLTWNKTCAELLIGRKDGSFLVRMKGMESVRTFDRVYEKQQDGRFMFSEYSDGKLFRTGISKLKFPLILDGDVVEYFDNGNLKSRSFFRNNELVSNRNWLENGEKYIDSLFYSVDEEPMLSGGNFILHKHIREELKASGFDISIVTGKILLGFVVMETGEMAGIRIMQGMGSQLNTIAVNAMKSLEGKWKPARLKGENVRYFQLFPISFISREISFQSLEFDGSRIHYDRY